ncbi:proteasome subunit RPN3 (RPN3) [Vairimorpha necatrix]|uniref:Proteasome subunit RPN3 (RPN3) n=1 Tax=Vairimorpha necatrix TaxID=6039 RepID=A0AAX4JES0_9MICR
MELAFLENILSTKDYDLFSRKYSEIFKKLDTETFQYLVSLRGGDLCLLLRTLEIVLLFKKKLFLEVVSYVENNIKGLLLGKYRSYDILISKILRMYYLSRKELGINNDICFNLLVPNKELGNEESVSVITNCLLDYLVSNKIYRRIENFIVPSELSKYNFYNGVIELVEGNYEKAFFLLDSPNNKGIRAVYLILASLLQSKFNIPVEYDKKIKIYFDLIRIVKEADLPGYMKFIEDHKDDLIKDNTFFIILRLSRNVIQEKIRCISLVYSKISYEDMSQRLNIDKEDLEYILLKSINSGLISGEVKDGVYYACKTKKKVTDKFKFENLKKLNSYIKSEMKYPEIQPLCYEKAIQ